MLNLTLAPTGQPRQFRAADGRLLTAPDDWDCLPPGDALLTRRVKAMGPCWTITEKRGRKTFSRGVWTAAANIEAARTQVEAERADPAYAKRLQASAKRREVAQSAYVEEFRAEVLAFLAFAPGYAEMAARLADAVTAHATPVGSGTVARTKRIDVDRRAEAAVVAWMRHQTTGYDDMKVARVKGARRQVRRQLAEKSRTILDAHRREGTHDAGRCPLCLALTPRTCTPCHPPA